MTTIRIDGVKVGFLIEPGLHGLWFSLLWADGQHLLTACSDVSGPDALGRAIHIALENGIVRASASKSPNDPHCAKTEPRKQGTRSSS